MAVMDEKQKTKICLDMESSSESLKKQKTQQKCKYWGCVWRRRGCFVLNPRWLLNVCDFLFAVLTAHPELGRHLRLGQLEKFLFVVEFVEHLPTEEVRDAFSLESRIEFNWPDALPEAKNFAGIVALITIDVKIFVDSVQGEKI